MSETCYVRWLAADDAWQAALAARFGDAAGAARYDARGRQGDLLPLYEAFAQLRDQWHQEQATIRVARV